MKNISSFLFMLSFLASFQLLGIEDSDSCPNKKMHRFLFKPLETACKHKKKIIAGTITVAIIFCFFKDQIEWNKLNEAFKSATIGHSSNSFNDNQKETIANALADFTLDSWFMPSSKKQYVAGLIEKDGNLFPNWKTIHNMNNGKLSFAKK